MHPGLVVDAYCLNLFTGWWKVFYPHHLCHRCACLAGLMKHPLFRPLSTLAHPPCLFSILRVLRQITLFSILVFLHQYNPHSVIICLLLWRLNFVIFQKFQLRKFQKLHRNSIFGKIYKTLGVHFRQGDFFNLLIAGPPQAGDLPQSPLSPPPTPSSPCQEPCSTSR